VPRQGIALTIPDPSAIFAALLLPLDNDQTMDPAINALLSPKSIAVLGASADFQKINGRTLKALLDKGYAGKIYPVNPSTRRSPA